MIFKGNFLYTPALGELTVREGEYLVVDGEKCAGFYRALPQEYAGQSVTDFGRALVLPAFCDLHLHAPQMVNRGVGYDQELLPWLETYTFPVEARYGDADFAEAAWKRFLNRMWANGTLRFSAFATIHKEAAWRLMELTERAGLSALIGKVNMDRNAPDSLREDTDASLADTEELICRSRAELKHVGYILTPRFVPSTTARLMDGLGRLGERYGLPVQSHLSENRSEIAWVGQLHPECASYTEVYRDYGLLRRGCTIMAHAVHLTGREEAILREEGVTLAHCAQSNTNLSSGVMPLRRSLSEGLRCCVASDVAGVYFVLCYFGNIFQLTFGPVQVRLGEALTVLPFLFPAAAPGLALGCLLTNILSPYGPIDMIVGTLATAIAAFLSIKMPRWYLAALPPIVVNALLLPPMWAWAEAGAINGAFWAAYGLNLWTFVAGEAVACYVLGTILLKALPRVRYFRPMIPTAHLQ